VFGPDEGQGYAQMRNGKEIRHPVTGAVRRYEGSATLHQWIKEADTYKGDEKTCVDKLVAENPSIIDLEMGLPKIARRMDCIALECDVNAVRIVFWEAKMIDDSRLRSRTDPEVIDQLRKYQEFLKDEGRARRIQIAYQTTCQLLNEIHRMALRFTDQPALDPLVMAAADRTTVLKVDPVPRLVIFGGTPYQKKGKWELHQARLESEKIPCLVFCDQPYRLRRAEVPA
jgi:hypothetical protein